MEKMPEQRAQGGMGLEQAIIDIRNMYKIYNPGENEVRALDGVSLAVYKGEFVAIVGHSGSGKSTLMNMIGCLDTPTSGTYFLNGQDVSALSDNALSAIRNEQIGFIFQSFNLIKNLNALENVELPLIYRGLPAGKRRLLALEALERVGLASRMDHRPNQMSGGQQQRVAVARAIAAHPPCSARRGQHHCTDHSRRRAGPQGSAHRAYHRRKDRRRGTGGFLKWKQRN